MHQLRSKTATVIRIQPVCDRLQTYADSWKKSIEGKSMDWVFEGIGTLLLGLLVGGAGGSVVTWRVVSNRQSQRQRAGSHSTQLQAGRDASRK